MKKSFLLFITALFTLVGYSQIVLSGTNYTQDFDGVGSGMPAGFTVRRSASATSLGTIETPIFTASAWSTSTGAYYNMASGDGLTAGSNSTAQNSSSDRVIALRQSNGYLNDGGAAFVMELANTNGFSAFTLSFKLQSLDVAAPRVTTWLVDYGFGTSPTTFTTVATSPLTISTGGSTFTSTAVNINFGSALNTINQPVWIRIVSFTPTTGSGVRPVTGIDDLSLNYSTGNGCTPPSTQSSAASISSVTSNSMNINWTAGSGTNSLVVVKSGSAVSGSPINGNFYSASSVFGSGQTIASGEYVVYNGIGNNVAITGLTFGTLYHVAVFTYDNTGYCYQTADPATTFATTICGEPGAQVSLITINASLTSASINWSGGNGTHSLVKINSTNSFTAPVDGFIYNANTTYSGGEQIIFNGTGSTGFVSGLSTGNNYYVTVYTYNLCSGNPDYFVANNVKKSFLTLNNNGIPVNYYNSTTGLACAPLKTALRNIINTGFVHHSYDDLWDIYQTGDIQPSELASGNVIWDIYSDDPTGLDPYEFIPGTNQCGSYSNEGDCYNREHSFPKSWFGGSESPGPGTDYHHIFPTDGSVNGYRSNYVYGSVGTASYTSSNGSKLGTSIWPGIAGTVFEPIDAYKGDVARAFLYMVTCYQNSMASWESLNTSGDIAMDGTSWPSVEPAYLQLMITWHNSDPISQKEIDRNNVAYGFQQNRNPFVDHPEYVEMIWSSLCNVLPVDIISFSGFNHSGKISLEWEVANAERFSAFIVERSIDGGRTFSERSAINYLQNLNSYKFDENAGLLQGDIYYRIKLVDISGAYRYSKVIRVTVREDKELVILYPNPATDKITISFPNPVDQPFNITITDLTGRVLIKSSLLPGLRNSDLNIDYLPVGTYLLNLRSAEKVIIKKFIRQ